jgi:(R,R)-butanediol dehydrogenase/meso-butanediol dehydrogenase/diacetyl reductase
MKAAVWHARRDIRVEEFPDPDAPRPDEVRLAITWCGICGTDLEEYTQGPLFIPPADRPNPITGRHAPMVIGHEFVGAVVRLGRDVTDLKVGDRVAVDTLIHCGECPFCLRHQVHLCERLAIMGLMTDGGLAEYINAPRYMCFKYADNLSDAHAALAEPASVAVRSARRGRLAEGESVVIVGAGNIGLLTVEVARAFGANKVIVVEPAESRRKVAMDLGATAAIDPLDTDPIEAVRRLTGGRGADVVFECAGITSTMALAPELARRAGRIVLVGLHDAPVPIRLVSVVTGEQELIGSFSHVYDEDFSAAVDMLSAGQILAEPLITAQIGLRDLVRCGLDELSTSKDKHLKILVSPEG